MFRFSVFAHFKVVFPLTFSLCNQYKILYFFYFFPLHISTFSHFECECAKNGVFMHFEKK
jgi:hypothetical protein